MPDDDRDEKAENAFAAVVETAAGFAVLQTGGDPEDAAEHFRKAAQFAELATKTAPPT